MIDPSTETVWLHRLNGLAPVVEQTFQRDQTLRSPLLPEFAVDLDDIFTS